MRKIQNVGFFIRDCFGFFIKKLNVIKNKNNKMGKGLFQIKRD